MGEALEQVSAPFAVLDLDWLCWAWAPALAGDELHNLLCDNVRVVVPHLLARGVHYLVMSRAILTPAGLAQLGEAVAPLPLRVVRLAADDDEVARRLHARDAGPRLDAHLARRAEFARLTRSASPSALEVDTTIDDAATVARTVLRALDWPCQ